MSKNSRYSTGVRSGDSSSKVLVCCRVCLHSVLFRYDNNPILAECHKKPNFGNEKFPFDVDVASTKRICRKFSASMVEKPVEQRTKTVI